jgi:hypothetical protein
LASGIGLESADLDLLERVVDRCEGLLEEMPALDGARSEVAFRRVQILLYQGKIEHAGEYVLNSGYLDESTYPVALKMLFTKAIKRFKERPSVPAGQAVIRYGRAILSSLPDNSNEELSFEDSLIGEGVAFAAEYLADETGDSTMREYGFAVSLRVFESGTATAEGLVRTASLSELFENTEVALECWLRLVEQLSDSDVRWHRARYESLRLLVSADPERARLVYKQYTTLYPEGSPSPWGERLGALFADIAGDGP